MLFRSQPAPAERILIEFVSANPTGPPHVGHARQAAYGDGVARILEYAGHDVTREYYVNDWGRQMQLFGASVAARYGQLFGLDTPVPEDGYQGEYVIGIAELMRDEVGDTYAARVNPPDDEVLAIAKAKCRYVLVTGEKDFNRAETKAVFEQGFRSEGFAAVTMLEAPGVGHGLPPATWLERGLDFLDEGKGVATAGAK